MVRSSDRLLLGRSYLEVISKVVPKIWARTNSAMVVGLTGTDGTERSLLTGRRDVWDAVLISKMAGGLVLVLDNRSGIAKGMALKNAGVEGMESRPV